MDGELQHKAPLCRECKPHIAVNALSPQAIASLDFAAPSDKFGDLTKMEREAITPWSWSLITLEHWIYRKSNKKGILLACALCGKNGDKWISQRYATEKEMPAGWRKQNKSKGEGSKEPIIFPPHVTLLDAYDYDRDYDHASGRYWGDE